MSSVLAGLYVGFAMATTHLAASAPPPQLAPLERLALLGQKHKAAAMFAGQGRADAARFALDLMATELGALVHDTTGVGHDEPHAGWEDAMAVSLLYVAEARLQLDGGQPGLARRALDRMALRWARLRARNQVAHWSDPLVFYQAAADEALERSANPDALRSLLPSLRYKLEAVRGIHLPLGYERRVRFADKVGEVVTSVKRLEAALAGGDRERIRAAALALRPSADALYEEFR